MVWRYLPLSPTLAPLLQEQGVNPLKVLTPNLADKIVPEVPWDKITLSEAPVDTVYHRRLAGDSVSGLEQNSGLLGLPIETQWAIADARKSPIGTNVKLHRKT
jgi:hypothetical protein